MHEDDLIVLAKTTYNLISQASFIKGTSFISHAVPLSSHCNTAQPTIATRQILSGDNRMLHNKELLLNFCHTDGTKHRNPEGFKMPQLFSLRAYTNIQRSYDAAVMLLLLHLFNLACDITGFCEVV